MHTRLCVWCRWGGGLGCSVVGGLGFGRWDTAEAVHEPAGVVPVDPGGGDLFQVGQGADGAVPERGAVADAFGLVQPDRGLGEGVVVGIAHAADRGLQALQQERLAEADRGVLRAGVGVVDRTLGQRVALAAPVAGGLPDRPSYEGALLAGRALPTGDQPGVGVD